MKLWSRHLTDRMADIERNYERKRNFEKENKEIDKVEGESERGLCWRRKKQVKEKEKKETEIKRGQEENQEIKSERE